MVLRNANASKNVLWRVLGNLQHGQAIGKAAYDKCELPWVSGPGPSPNREAPLPRVAECHGSRGYIRVKKGPNVEKLINFLIMGKSLFKYFLCVNYLTFCNSGSTLS